MSAIRRVTLKRAPQRGLVFPSSSRRRLVRIDLKKQSESETLLNKRIKKKPVQTQTQQYDQNGYNQTWCNQDW